MSVKTWFTAHPRAIGESYFEHAKFALSFGGAMLRGSIACFVHAAFPALCTTSGSRIVAQLHDRMVLSRTRLKSIAQSHPNPEQFIAEHI